MRIKTQSFVLTFHGNTSFIELDLSKDQPQLIIPTTDGIQVSLDQVTPSSSSHKESGSDRITDAFAKTLVVFKNESSGYLSSQLTTQSSQPQNPIKTSPSVVEPNKPIKQERAKRNAKDANPAFIRNQDWFKNLSVNELLTFFDASNASSIAESIKKYQKLNHLAATLSLFKEGLVPTQAVVKKITYRFRTQQSSIEKNCIQVPLALKLIQKVEMSADKKNPRNYDLYTITSLGQDVLTKLVEYAKEKQEYFQQKRNNFIAKNLGQETLTQLVDYMNERQEQLPQKRDNFIESILKDKK